jgi:hypothetical protein
MGMIVKKRRYSVMRKKSSPCDLLFLLMKEITDKEEMLRERPIAIQFQ